MIEWLTDWLTQIIIVVLLAVFMDMILPGTSMHRYVKLVMGLFILMTMLSPILSIISKDFSFQEMVADMVNNPVMEGTNREAFEQQAGKLQDIQQHQSRDYMQHYIRSQIMEQIETSYPVQVQDVDVETVLKVTSGPEGGEMTIPHIEKVSILLKKTDEKHADSDSGEEIESVRTVGAVDPIEPVVIENIRIGEDEDKASKEAVSQQTKQSGENYIKWEREIKNEIQQWWQLESGQIEIRWMTG